MAKLLLEDFLVHMVKHFFKGHCEHWEEWAVNDPGTYLLLLISGFLAAALSGAAGFGGALLLLPLLSGTIGTTMAVPVLTMAQLFGNLSRVFIGRKQICWKPVGLFTAGAIPMSLLRALSFIRLPHQTATRLIGAVLIAMVILKQAGMINFKSNNRTTIGAGMVVGLLPSLVGSAGPLGAAFFLSLNLPPISYIASEAVTATAMHVSKTIIYQRYLGFGADALTLGALIGLSMIAGTSLGIRLVRNMPQKRFSGLVSLLLLLAGLQMLIAG